MVIFKTSYRYVYPEMQIIVKKHLYGPGIEGATGGLYYMLPVARMDQQPSLNKQASGKVTCRLLDKKTIYFPICTGLFDNSDRKL